MTRYFLGLDLGQSQDYTALVVAEQVPAVGVRSSVVYQYHLRHLERLKLGTPYPEVAERVKALLASPALKGCSRLVVDSTGVGMPVLDMLRQHGLSPIGITITGGDLASHEGTKWRVPKRDLVSTMQVLLQTQRLKVAEGLPDAAVLVEELLNFRVKIDPLTAHDSYGAWREKEHDDLVLAVALACWYGERGHGFKVW